MSWACTVHKVQGKTFQKIVFSFNLLKQKRFNSGQVYVALSRVTSLEGLFLTGTFSKKFICFDQRATDEYQYMREHAPLESIGNVEESDTNILVFSLLNVRSLQKHVTDVQKDKCLMKSNLLFLTETQLTFESNTSMIRETLNEYSLLANSWNNHRFSSIALAHQSDIIITDMHDIPGATLYTIVTPRFMETPLNFILLYRQNQLPQTQFLDMLRHLQYQVDEEVHFILGDFNINYYKDECNFLREYLTDYEMVANTPTHISGSLIDHVYIHKNIINVINIDVLIHSVYFSDHEAVIIKINRK